MSLGGDNDVKKAISSLISKKESEAKSKNNMMDIDN